MLQAAVGVGADGRPRGRGAPHGAALGRHWRERRGGGGGGGGRGGGHREARGEALQRCLRVRVVLLLLRPLGAAGAASCGGRPAGVLAVVDDVEERGVVVGALHLLGGRAVLRVAVRAAVVGPRVLGAQDVLLAVLAPAVAVVGGALGAAARGADAHLLAGPARRGLALLGAGAGGAEGVVVVVVGGGVAAADRAPGGGQRRGGSEVRRGRAEHADGVVGERDDLVDEAAAEVDGGGVRGRAQLLLELAHQVLHAAQLRDQERPPAALHGISHCCFDEDRSREASAGAGAGEAGPVRSVVAARGLCCVRWRAIGVKWLGLTWRRRTGGWRGWRAGVL